MTTDIIPIIDPLIKLGERIDAAYARTQRGRREWIEGSLELAQAFAEGRDRFSSDSDFGAWLGKNGHAYVEKNGSAAFIIFGRDLKFARIAFEETTRSSYRYIWDDVKDRLPQMGKPTTTSDQATETAAKMTSSSANIKSTVEKSTPKLHPRSRLFGLDRAAEIAVVFTSADTRAVLGRDLHQRKGSKVAWQMILRGHSDGRSAKRLCCLCVDEDHDKNSSTVSALAESDSGLGGAIQSKQTAARIEARSSFLNCQFNISRG